MVEGADMIIRKQIKYSFVVYNLTQTKPYLTGKHCVNKYKKMFRCRPKKLIPKESLPYAAWQLKGWTPPTTGMSCLLRADQKSY